MIYFGQHFDSDQPGSSKRKTPLTSPANQPRAAVRVVTTGRRPEGAA
ncbi:MAG: hypothetical protein Q8T13_07460 [Acidobacteriota bacterium]|nr:hypothetical protein [Acidobacteriota bacterium]